MPTGPNTIVLMVGFNLALLSEMSGRTAPGWMWVGMVVLFMTGCTPALQSAAKGVANSAVPAAIDSSLQTLEEKRTQEQVLAIMSSPEMQRSLELMARSFTKGATETLTSDEMAKTSRDMVSSIAATATRVAVEAAMSEIASPANKQRMSELVSAATSAATRSAIQTMADELPRSLGPALGEMLRQNVAPNVRGLVTDPETRSTLGAIAFEASRQAVFGSNEAMAELEKRKNKSGLLAHLGGIVAQGGLIVTIVLVAFGVGIVALFAALVHTRSKLRHARSDERLDHEGEERPRASHKEPLGVGESPRAPAH